MRLATAQEVIDATAKYMPTIKGFEPDEWCRNPGNVALINENNDVALFERQYYFPALVMGHYFFLSRGKEAKKAANEFLTEIFTGGYGVEVISGFTPEDHKGALWMNRYLGFKQYGTIEHEGIVYHLVTLTKKEWLNE